VSHLLGHEGEGSLLSYLKSKGLVNALSAGGGSSETDFDMYEVREVPMDILLLSLIEGQLLISCCDMVGGGGSYC